MRTVLSAFIACLLILQTAYSQTTPAARTYADNSVLAQGQWYKIGVTQDGIYRLDNTFFSNLGISPSSINPRTIRIFGNGGGMIPQANIAERLDDLQENYIHVEGENDGSFNVGDYVLFFGEGPHSWDYNAETQLFDHEYNLYSDTNFYFLNIGEENGLRITEELTPNPTPYEITQGHGFQFYELDKTNLIRSGRYWLGEKFDLITERTYSFYAPDATTNPTLGSEIEVNIRVAARSDLSTSFDIYTGNTKLGTMALASVSVSSSQATYYSHLTQSFSFDPSLVQGDSISLRFVYDKKGSINSEAWLDWIEVDYAKDLNVRNASNYSFALKEAIGSGEVARINLTNAGSAYQIWDITNPTHVMRKPFNANGSTLTFDAPLDNYRKFMVFNGGFKTPISAKTVFNQNLHGLPLADYLMIVYPEFMAEADRLANFHRNYYNRTVHLVTPGQIYNEFSSGRQDVSAIRDFIKMFYDRSNGTQPGFVLLFGDGSFDYKNHTNVPNVTNFIPTYQSRNSNTPTSTYTSDDYYAFLDDDEGFWGEGSGLDGDNGVQMNLLDVSLGRLPVETLTEAQEVVDKIIQYVTDSVGLGSWRSKILLVADHKEGEGSTHVSQADSYTSLINQAEPCFNLDKIYMDNYPMVNTAAGTRFPEGRSALLAKLEEGSLIVNYTGHGGESTWSNSRILELTDIQSLQNEHRIPAVITATCEFGRFDDHDRRSGAEWMVLNPTAGAIAMFTTVRLVFSSPNKDLNENFYRYVLTYDADKQRMPTLGEVMRYTKNQTFPESSFNDLNSRNFTLLGDPGLILNYPELKAEITSINGQPIVQGEVDSLNSLALVEVVGQIKDANGTPITDYNGDLSITIFDKPSKFVTNLSNFPFYWQKNRIFNGASTIENGEFRFEFVVPIDISYEEGFGKMSFYFSDGVRDGAGCYNDLYIGGTDPNATPDDEGPTINLFINDNTWVDGGITDSNPYLYAEVYDESGINTIGSAIGHEISAILDNDASNPLILNEYYTATENSYKEGSIRYRLSDLPEGEHTLSIRVWDVANNAAEDYTSFIVTNDAILALEQIFNYPNPMTDQTNFWVSHNQTGKELEVSIEIFSNDGKKVKRLVSDFTASGNVYKELQWDGMSDAGFPIAPGIYSYRVLLTDKATSQQVMGFNKLVLIK